MNPIEFRKERQGHWMMLRALVSRIERGGVRALSVEEARKLGSLYRSTVSSYTMLKGLTLDRKLVVFLRDLVTRAYLAIYHFESRPDFHPIRFFGRDWPRLVARHSGMLLLATGVFVAAAALAFLLSADDPQLTDALMPSGLAQGRGSDSTREELLFVLRSGRDSGAGEKTFFLAFLFRNNTQVGFLSFALGIFGGIPALGLLVYNGFPLGALAGLYENRGLSFEFWAWILPHGITEILAILLCAQAGLVVGFRAIRPGALRWRDAVFAAGRDGGLMVLGTVPMYFLAAIFESVVRQSGLSDPARYGVALATLAAWGAFFLIAGRGAAAEETADRLVIRQL